VTILALDIERPSILGPGQPEPLADDARLTLDDVIVGAWDELLVHRRVSCPVCSGSMKPRYGAGAAPVGGRCADCGSALG
jgi:DnaJ-class molecular chaperone